MSRPEPPSNLGRGAPNEVSAIERLADVLRAASDLGEREVGLVASCLGQACGEGPVDAALVRLAEAGVPEAMLALGERHKDDDPAVALGWLQRAAAQGSPGAITWLGRVHHDAGHLAEAEALFTEAADRGDAVALHELARHALASGHTAKAAELLAAAGRLGNADSLSDLGALRASEGESEESERLYREAADAGSIVGASNLGTRLAQAGRTAEAIRWLTVGAEAGNADAALVLASVHEMSGDSEQAVKDRARAAALGSAEAAEWFARAAEAATAARAAASVGDYPADEGPDAAVRRGHVLMAQGHVDRAVAAYRQAAAARSFVAELSLLLAATRSDYPSSG